MDTKNSPKHTEIKETYEARVTVGRDTFDVECIVLKDFEWFKKKEIKTFKDVWDTITIPYYDVKWWVRYIYHEVCYGFQRMFRGYDETDTFETYDRFIKRYSKILTDYRKHHYGFPGEMTEEEWDNIVDEMIYHLKYMDEETVREELNKDIPDNWAVASRYAWEIMDKHKEEFFKLFSKYFFHLWD